MEAKSTKELTEIVDLGLGIISVGEAAMKDGKVDVSDLALLFQLVPLVAPAIDGMGEIPAEVADLSEQEAADLAAHVMLKLSIGDAHAREVVEKSLKAAAAVYALVKAIKTPVAAPAPVSA